MGAFPRRQVRKPMPMPPPVIDLRDKPAPRRMEFGFPTPCPDCGRTGYLDYIDPLRREMLQHCPTCLTKWVVTEEELARA